ncbi:undecaprenyldiphospho-muramoylpentapeptide beta-N-acetylglucosaminyltransferase [Romeria aff. gracilis LEGE 07310]|uniref:UDP-N-acetylglucosamine--N-acetylmuramyl-(pentapeptide) pyrophosphoryl-undecaprenol N-acetylglucosamine transferase n=1 Tax=Vasconcelosia minhoensis LEGE 07310 TaxID=915328 RepID=A0A8J7DBY3_9CYAN|nr:undecaprenyldiphospho-muramoylpentapeptide beta-N-acetylglucosaminyltransferase [Romeria gracilis]MBE9077093.1 undecaprenyldiphospho-muramoylpentapeptide beta-N-acetylglucosaminyltransferase [Romeria aff. gracilis LEGE 07310]
MGAKQSTSSAKLLIAASGTGGHLFPAIALAQQLPDYSIEWLGVPDRLETELVPQEYPLHQVRMGGVQGRIGFSILRLGQQFFSSIIQIRRLLQRGGFQAVFTTGGYIAAPAIIAARTLGLPTVLHESNALPGKVTRWLSPRCSIVAVGFEAATSYLPKAKTICVGTPVRSQFLTAAEPLDLEIPDNAPVIVVIGGSQGAVAVNQLVRQAAPAWFEAGAWIVHLTGNSDPDANSLSHPQYIHRPFYPHMAALFRRANLSISRAGAGTLTELAITGTPSILIPYPYAAEDHQTYNAQAFVSAGAARLQQQSSLSAEQLQEMVLELIQSPAQLATMGAAAEGLATADSAQKLADVVRGLVG